MFTKLIPKIIQEKLKAKENALSWKTKNFGQYEKGAITPKEINSRTTFVRMCSNKLNVPNIVISGGELNGSDGSIEFGVSHKKDSSLYKNKKDISGKEYGLRPISGIKNIEVAYKGSWKAIREATVTWVVSSISDLERLTPYFLTVGKTVALEWGWVNPKSNSYAKMFNGQSPFITFKDGKFNVNQDIFNDPQFKIQKSGGDYDALAGKISNFETVLREDGGFDCTTKITAMGALLFNKPIDKPANAFQIEGSDDKKASFDSDNIINAIINLRGIILTTEFGIADDKIDLSEVSGTENSRKNIAENLTSSGLKGGKPPLGSRHIHHTTKYGFAVNNLNNPQILWMWNNGREEIFVKWGWMEDQLLNRYASVKAGEENDIKLTIRSIDTVLNDDTNLPETVSSVKDIEDLRQKSQNLEDQASKIENPDADLDYWKNKDKDEPLPPGTFPNEYIVQPGDNLHKIADKFEGVTVDDLIVFNNILNPDNIQPGQILQFMGDLTDDWVYGEDPASKQKEKEIQELRSKAAAVDEKITKAVQRKDILDYADLNDVDENNRGKYLKTPTLIKNLKKFLKPKNPLTFFSTELLPTYKEVAQIEAGGNPILEYLYKWANMNTGLETTDFESFWNALRGIDNKEFTQPGNDGVGRLRYMWVNIKQIQEAFGVTMGSVASSKPTSVSPPGTLEEGIKRLLLRLNTNFYDFWNFELTVDTYDPSNIKVIDKKNVDISKDSIKYTKFKPNSHKVASRGIYQFPAFNIGSIVKNQTLSFKIPDSMAITTMVGSNKKDKKNQPSHAFNNPDIMKVFGTDKPKEGETLDIWSDRYLYDIKSSTIPNSSGSSFVTVGSQSTNHNSKIVEEEGLTIQPKPWWKRWMGNNEIDEPHKKDLSKVQKHQFKIIDDNIVHYVETPVYEKMKKAAPGTTSSVDVIGKNKAPDRKIKGYRSGEFEKSGRHPPYYFIQDGNLMILPELERAIRSRLSGGVIQGEVEKSLEVDTIIPAELSLEIDGIGGLVPGDICQTAYIQPKYNINFKKDEDSFGPFTYFQIVGITQRVDLSNWITELSTKMRINHIPDIEGLVIEKVKKLDEVKKQPGIPSIPSEGEAVTADDIDINDFEGPVEVGITNIGTKSRTFRLGTYDEMIDTDNLWATTYNKKLLPKISSTLSDVVQVGSSYSNLRVGVAGFKLNIEAYEKAPVRPSIPVKTADEAEPDDVVLDPLKYDDFAEWLSPALGFIKRTTTSELIVEVEKKDETTKKSHKGRKRISTFPGWGAHDGYLYDKYIYAPRHHANWRPSYKYPDGSRSWKSHKIINNITYDFFMGDSNSEGFETVVVEIKKMRDEDEIQSYWDGYIEEPSNTGRTALREDGSSPTLETYTPGLMIGGN